MDAGRDDNKIYAIKFTLWLLITLFTIYMLTGCDSLALTTVVAGQITEEPELDVGTPEPSQITDPTDKTVTDRDIINQITASSLEVAGGMIQSGATDFVWARASDLTAKGLALSMEEQVTLYSIDPPADAGQIPDSNPSLLTSADHSETIAWKNADDTVRVWDLIRGQELLSVPGEEEALTSLSLSSAGDMLAIATFDNRVEIWDVRGKQLTQDFESPAWLSNLDFSPDERLMAGVDAPNFMVRLFDIENGIEVRNLSWADHASPVLYGAYFSPDWKILAWVARGSIQLMDPNDGTLGPMLNHEDFVSAIAWSPDGSIFASAAAGSINGEYAPLVYLWNPLTGERINTLVLKEPVASLSFSPDGREFAVLSTSGALQLWVVQN